MRLSTLFSDGMILQRDCENPIRGFFENEKEVSVSFDSSVLDTEISGDTWTAKIPAQKAGGPHTISIVCDGKTTTISDIYFGDVFVLGGQSNMELPIIWTTDCYYDEIISADFPLIRQFEVPKIPDCSDKHDIYEDGKWAPCNIKNIWGFSAIGFYFAKYKFLKDNIPVGLIQTAVGGAPVESLMSEENLLSSFSKIKSLHGEHGKCNNDKSKCCIFCYEEKLKQNHDKDFVRKTMKDDMTRQDAWHQELDEMDPGIKEHWENAWDESSDYEIFAMPSTFYQTKYEDFKGSVWLQKKVTVPAAWCDKHVELRLGTLMDSDTTYVNGINVGGFGFKYPPRRYFLEPGTLKEGENIITIRLGIDGNIGGAVKDCPYYLLCEDEKISLEGEWKMRFGGTMTRLEGPTFFNWAPVALYNSMIHPLAHVNCRSILFYQGESNCEYPSYYGALLKDMVKEWRDLLGSDVPFLMAEVTYWLGDGPVYEEDPFDAVREAQRQVICEIPNGHLIKTYDLGQYNDLHPQNKKDVAMRFLKAYEDLSE